MRQRVAGRPEAADRDVLILDTRLDQYGRRKVGEIIEIPEALLADFAAGENLYRERNLLQRLSTTLRCYYDLLERQSSLLRNNHIGLHENNSYCRRGKSCRRFSR